MKSLNTIQKFSLLVAVLFTIIAPTFGYLKIGLPPIIIIGGSALIGFTFWYFTYLKNPTDPRIILPIFVLTVAALQIHIVEEYLTGFGPAMSRLFNIPWSEKSFVIVFALVGPTIYTLTTLGLYYRVPLAGFIAWFIFIGPGVAEFTHFIFPLMEPNLEPSNLSNITQTIKGTEIANMPNYFTKATGRYYFSGMYTAILPMIPGIYAIYRLTREHIKKSGLKRQEHKISPQSSVVSIS
ncbi:MAG: hypothetical protein ABUT20_28225 [Bacteroidota bacterium]